MGQGRAQRGVWRGHWPDIYWAFLPALPQALERTAIARFGGGGLRRSRPLGVRPRPVADGVVSPELGTRACAAGTAGTAPPAPAAACPGEPATPFPPRPRAAGRADHRRPGGVRGDAGAAPRRARF